MKDDRTGGGKEREIELGMKKMRERLMETQEHDEHIGKANQKRNQTFSKTYAAFRLHFAFYGGRGRYLRQNVTSRHLFPLIGRLASHRWYFLLMTFCWLSD